MNAIQEAVLWVILAISPRHEVLWVDPLHGKAYRAVGWEQSGSWCSAHQVGFEIGCYTVDDSHVRLGGGWRITYTQNMNHPLRGYHRYAMLLGDWCSSE